MSTIEQDKLFKEFDKFKDEALIGNWQRLQQSITSLRQSSGYSSKSGVRDHDVPGLCTLQHQQKVIAHIIESRSEEARRLVDQATDKVFVQLSAKLKKNCIPGAKKIENPYSTEYLTTANFIEFYKSIAATLLPSVESELKRRVEIANKLNFKEGESIWWCACHGAQLQAIQVLLKKCVSNSPSANESKHPSKV